jgi:hypothetical protein
LLLSMNKTLVFSVDLMMKYDVSCVKSCDE